MKKCPNCYADVENDFELCWNCQYSFADHKVLIDKDFDVICPKCNAVTSSSFRFCTNCKSDLKDLQKEMGKTYSSPKNIDCLRCKVPMEYQGNFNFHEGTRYGALGNMFELLVHKQSFDLYHCPDCGKVEFFLP